MKVKMKKKEVFEAVLTEPVLSGGMFVDTGDCQVVTRNSCPACAVGAIMINSYEKAYKRNLRIFGKQFANNIADMAVNNSEDCYKLSDLNRAYKIDNPLSILSCEFEHASSYMADGHDARMHAIMVVEGIFPDQIEVEVL
jgi:hypothetical protein